MISTAARRPSQGRVRSGIGVSAVKPLRARQPDPEGRSLPELALDLYSTVEGGQNSMTDRQPEPGADPGRLGGEEGVEDMGKYFGRDSPTRVGDVDGDQPVRVARGQGDGVVLGPSLGNGLRGIDQQIEKDLPEARFVGLDEGHLSEVADQRRARFQLVARHSDCRLEHLVHVDGLPSFPVRMREDAQIAGDDPDPFGAFFGIGRRLPERRRGGGDEVGLVSRPAVSRQLAEERFDLLPDDLQVAGHHG